MKKVIIIASLLAAASADGAGMLFRSQAGKELLAAVLAKAADGRALSGALASGMEGIGDARLRAQVALSLARLHRGEEVSADKVHDLIARLDNLPEKGDDGLEEFSLNLFEGGPALDID